MNSLNVPNVRCPHCRLLIATAGPAVGGTAGAVAPDDIGQPLRLSHHVLASVPAVVDVAVTGPLLRIGPTPTTAVTRGHPVVGATVLIVTDVLHLGVRALGLTAVTVPVVTNAQLGSGPHRGPPDVRRLVIHLELRHRLPGVVPLLLLLAQQWLNVLRQLVVLCRRLLLLL